MLTKKKSIVLMHGFFDPSVFSRTKKSQQYFVLEGRPALESVKDTCKQLKKKKIVPTLIADNMAGFLFYKDLVKEVWLSYQTTDKEGAMCQIGGLILSVLGKKHKVPVYLFPSAHKMKLMGRSKEICSFNGVQTVPGNVTGYVPLVERVPKKYYGKVYGH